ncbi:MAG TPA: hypothetical protein VFG90_05470 [Nitrososphaeraceae archaeon]|nr:hypothetical protein [Nitrososphaeraceae archaeon]
MGLKVITVSVGIGILLIINALGNGLNSAYAKHDTVRVDCKDLAIDLISWDGLYGYINDDDLADLEDDFADDPDNDVDPSSFDDIIDEHMEDLLDDFEDSKCEKHINEDLEEWVEDIDFEK